MESTSRWHQSQAWMRTWVVLLWGNRCLSQSLKPKPRFDRGIYGALRAYRRGTYRYVSCKADRHPIANLDPATAPCSVVNAAARLDCSRSICSTFSSDVNAQLFAILLLNLLVSQLFGLVDSAIELV